ACAAGAFALLRARRRIEVEADAAAPLVVEGEVRGRDHREDDDDRLPESANVSAHGCSGSIACRPSLTNARANGSHLRRKMTTPLRARIDAAALALRDRIAKAGAEPPRVTVVLGSGLGAFADGLANPVAIPYAEVPGLPAATVPGHKGRYVFGRAAGAPDLPIVALQGRVHLYEGHSAEEVTLGLRAAIALGARAVI